MKQVILCKVLYSLAAANQNDTFFMLFSSLYKKFLSMYQELRTPFAKQRKIFQEHLQIDLTSFRF